MDRSRHHRRFAAAYRVPMDARKTRTKAEGREPQSVNGAKSLDATREHCGVPDVRRRSECLEPRFCVGGNLETVDEGVKRLARHAAFSPGQRFQLLIRIRRTVTPHDGLNRLGEHFPVGFEIAGKSSRIDLEPGKTAPA